jgi:hypothetical protein
MKKLGLQWVGDPKPGELYWNQYFDYDLPVTGVQTYKYMGYTPVVLFVGDAGGVLYIYVPRDWKNWIKESRVILDLLRAGGADVLEQVKWDYEL